MRTVPGTASPASEELPGSRERVLACVSGEALVGRVLRAANQLAASLQTDWWAVYVETPEHYRLTEEERERVARALAQAEAWGAQTVILPGQNVVQEIMRFAAANGITKIVVGRPARQPWSRVLGTSLADELVRANTNIDVLIVTTGTGVERLPRFASDVRNRAAAGYLFALLAVGAATAVGSLLRPYLDAPNVALVYLLAVVLSATTWGLGPSILSSVVSVVLLDALFLPPYGFISVGGPNDLVTLGVFLLVGLVISELGSRVRAQIAVAQRREQEIAALYALSGKTAFATERAELLEAAIKQIEEVFGAEATVLLPDSGGSLKPTRPLELTTEEQGAAAESFREGATGGRADAALDGRLTLLPLSTAQGTFGVLAVRPQPGSSVRPEQDRLLRTFAGQIAVALEQEQLRGQAEQAKLWEASDRFRTALLSSISHDLRTPLASILGSATSLLDSSADISPAARSDLVVTIKEEATRLNRLVSNLLNMSRVESGALRPRREWHSLEEVIGAAVAAVDANDRQLMVDVPADLPLAPFDFVLIEQVLINLLENAVKFSGPGSTVEIRARAERDRFRVEVLDRGIGIPESELGLVFEKFYRAQETGTRPGSGLGLAICRGIIEAHGGSIRAERRPGGGTCITFDLPAAMQE